MSEFFFNVRKTYLNPFNFQIIIMTLAREIYSYYNVFNNTWRYYRRYIFAVFAPFLSGKLKTNLGEWNSQGCSQQPQHWIQDSLVKVIIGGHLINIYGKHLWKMFTLCNFNGADVCEWTTEELRKINQEILRGHSETWRIISFPFRKCFTKINDPYYLLLFTYSVEDAGIVLNSKLSKNL